MLAMTVSLMRFLIPASTWYIIAALLLLFSGGFTLLLQDPVTLIRDHLYTDLSIFGMSDLHLSVEVTKPDCSLIHPTGSPQGVQHSLHAPQVTGLKQTKLGRNISACRSSMHMFMIISNCPLPTSMVALVPENQHVYSTPYNSWLYQRHNMATICICMMAMGINNYVFVM